MDVQTAARRAALAAGTDSTEEDPAGDHLEVGVGHNDDGVVATELKQGAAEATGNDLADLLTGSTAAREAHERDARVLDEGLADVGTAAGQRGDGGVDVVAEQHALDDLLRGDGAQVRRGGALPDLRVAADHRDGRVPAGDGDGEVEGGNNADDAEGVPLLHHEVARALRRQHLAGDLARVTARQVADVDVLLHLADALGEDLAHLQGEQLAERVAHLAELIADLAHDLAAGGRGHRRPLLEGACRVAGAAVVVGGRGELDAEAGGVAVDGGHDVDDLTAGLPLLAVEAASVDLRELELGGELGHLALHIEAAQRAAKHFLLIFR
eukprot:PhM_4_TR3707/c0_g1_i1/m.62848